MSSYTDTFILEANRRHSAQFNIDQEEARGNWTNMVNAGIQLDVGDQVTVHSAMISDLGAESGTIEFKGKNIAPINSQLYNESVASFPDDTYKVDIQPAHHPTEIYTATQTTNLLPLLDNEAKIALNFYKNSNAEYSITLPQMWSTMDNASGLPASVGWGPDTGRGNAGTLTGHVVATVTTGYGQVPVSPGLDRRCDSDWRSFDGLSIKDFDRVGTGLGVGEPRNASFTNSQLKLDNKRFMLFVRKKTYNYSISTDPVPNENQKFIDLAVRDPALADYIPYSQLLDIDVPLGFNTPSEISSVLTERLNKLRDTSDITIRYESDGLRAPGTQISVPAGTPMEQKVSQKQESNLLRLINCATPFTNNYLNSDKYFGQSLVPNVADFDDVAGYLSGYQFVGFRRPDFVEKGRVLAKLSPSIYKLGNASFDEMRSCLDDSGMILGEVGENPGYRQDAYVYTYTPIVTNIEYTTENLEKYMDWFATQGNYEELFELDNNNVYKFENNGFGGSAHQYKGNADDITIDTHRFVHMNKQDNLYSPLQNVALNAAATPVAVVAPTVIGTENGAAFGWDGYQTTAQYGPAQALTDWTSVPLFIRFNKDEFNNRNIYKDGNFQFNSAPPNNKQLYGGIMMRGLHRSTGLYDRIAFLAQVPEQYCILTAGAGLVHYPAAADSKWIAGHLANYDNRKIGYDKHYSAYGNAAMMMFSGYASESDHNRTGLTRNYLKADNLTATGSAWDFNYTKFLNQIYVGANAPLINFNDSKSRFEISDLHTPERVGNPSGVGFVNSASSYLGVTPGSEVLGKAVYQINKRPEGTTFCPNVMPYGGVTLDYTGAAAKQGEKASLVPTPHPAIEPYAIFDAHCGVLIRDWGIPKKYWNDSIWGIMGFSYLQFNPQDDGIIGNINKRITSTTDNDISYLTTNSDFVASNMMGNTVNIMSNNLYKPGIISPPSTFINKLSGQDDWTNFPLITGITSSATITAFSLPTKTIRPYYTIRSDILQDSNYFGAQDQFSVAPVIAVVSKQNQYGDFFYSQASELIFTVTNPVTITEINTQICDPEGDIANVSPNSVVFYQITKNNMARHDIAQQIQEANKKN